MNAKEFLQTALGGNMNLGTLKPLVIEEIMEQYARQQSHQTSEADVTLNNLLKLFDRAITLLTDVEVAQVFDGADMDIVPVDLAQLDRIKKLVEGVEF